MLNLTFEVDYQTTRLDEFKPCFFCHNSCSHLFHIFVILRGALRNAIGIGAKKIPYVGTDMQQQTMSVIYLGILEDNVVQKHL